MPVSVQLILVGDVEQATFLEIRCKQLHAHWQAIDKTGWHRQARQAREVGGNGVDVFQVGRNRIAVFSADFQAGLGVVGPRMMSTSLNAVMKSFLIRRRIFCACR